MAPVFKPLMPLDEAWSRLQHLALAHREAQPVATEWVDSFEALGRVLAQPVRADVNVPPEDNSAMDGYGVRAADLASASVSAPRALALVQRIAAGQVGEALVHDSCVRIFTGAPIPPGCDTVVMQEHAAPLSNGHVAFAQPAPLGANIRRRGEDIAQGSIVLAAGVALTAAGLGVAASVGAQQLVVYRQPRVAVLTTGNELVMPGQPLPAGAIYNSNRHTLRGLVQACGGRASDLGIVPDDLASTRAALRAAAAQHDLILTSGGVSVGEEDHLRAAVQAEGELDFWALAIKPGKPFVCGAIRRPDGSRALYMGLPGNPTASFVTFLLLVRPVLALLAGQGWALPQALRLPAAFAWPWPDKRREFLRVRRNTDGGLDLYPHQGSGVLTSAAWSDGLVDLAPGQTVAEGDGVPYLPLAELLQPAALARQPGSA